MFTQIIEFLAHIVISMIESIGYFGVFLAMAIESACVPLPSEIIMPFAGYLVYKGEFNFWLVAAVGALGNLAGSLAAYYIGRWGGLPLVEKYGKYFLISHHDIVLAHRWFEKHGKSTVFFTRMMPVVRTFISLPAGVSEMNVKTFSLYTFLGALPWSIALTYIGMKLGENWNTLGDYFHKADLAIGLVLVIGLVWYIRRHIHHMKNPADLSGLKKKKQGK
ncbi:DedA family protein [candidate division WS5 bacterium]|uniref:DedA family protein n=1 Tax=candidate division WS5 bacterium TaxID=2093353 RepID=A0A419DC87_9BACT|nr:MAG: DedA family protein [candidate division WS5 bacterium]